MLVPNRGRQHWYKAWSKRSAANGLMINTCGNAAPHRRRITRAVIVAEFRQAAYPSQFGKERPSRSGIGKKDGVECDYRGCGSVDLLPGSCGRIGIAEGDPVSLQHCLVHYLAGIPVNTNGWFTGICGKTAGGREILICRSLCRS